MLCGLAPSLSGALSTCPQNARGRIDHQQRCRPRIMGTRATGVIYNAWASAEGEAGFPITPPLCQGLGFHQIITRERETAKLDQTELGLICT